MSLRIRGQEVTIRVAVDGEVQDGSFIKITDFTVTPRTDLNEESFLGELEDDLDIQHHGFDFGWTVQKEDEKALEFLSTVIDREQNQQVHPDITITVIYAFRKPGASNRAEVYHEVFLKVNEGGFGGRKEYVTTGFEGKCKKRSLLAA